jgi:Cof subfamily protein (haloacid dehalogenase superfamily)
MFVEPLGLTTPLAAFNGGLLVDPDMNAIEEKTIRVDLAAPIIDLLHGHGLSVWVYQGADWFVLDKDGPHVQHESRGCVCAPTKLASFEGVDDGITKVVGVSDDASAGAAAGAAMREQFGERVSATRSQSYFLDVTHPDANKGHVVEYLSTMYDVTTDEIATIGDMHNDVSMFAVSGLSIAMGNAEASVQQAAHQVTRSNDDEGFAYAVTEFVLRS